MSESVPVRLWVRPEPIEWELVPGSSGRFTSPKFRHATLEDFGPADVERVARALYETAPVSQQFRQRTYEGKDSRWWTVLWDGLPEGWKNDYRRRARAAIEALLAASSDECASPHEGATRSNRGETNA